MTAPTPDPAEVAAIAVPVITLWQPWASLIFATNAFGTAIKKHETRSWKYPAKLEGAEIAIHAAKKFPAWRHIGADLHELCLEAFGCQYHETLPFGRILGTVRLTGCYPTAVVSPDEDDRISGVWDEGRFAWRLANVTALARPMPFAGKQGWGRIDRALLASEAGR